MGGWVDHAEWAVFFYPRLCYWDWVEEWEEEDFISFSIWLNEGLACMLIVVTFLKLYQVTGGMAEGELVYWYRSRTQTRTPDLPCFKTHSSNQGTRRMK